MLIYTINALLRTGENGSEKKNPCIIYYKIVFASGKGCRDRWTGDKIFIPLT